jgi:hypothetical protein
MQQKYRTPDPVFTKTHIALLFLKWHPNATMGKEMKSSSEKQHQRDIILFIAMGVIGVIAFILMLNWADWWPW